MVEFPLWVFAMICCFFFCCWVGLGCFLTDLSGVEESVRGYDTEHDEGGGGACVVF